MVFFIVSLALVIISQVFLVLTFYYIRRKYETTQRVEKKHWISTNVMVISITLIGIALNTHLINKEREELKEYSFLIGELIASNYHIQATTYFQNPTDSKNLDYYEAMTLLRDWQEQTEDVISIYTMKKNVNGEYYFVLAPETDYNGDGKITGEDEQKVEIGTLYKESIPELESAFKGIPGLQEEVTVDQWGSSISAYYPIKNAHGKTTAIIGIDFDSKSYTSRVNQERNKSIIIMILLFAIYHTGSVLFVKQHYENKYRINKEREKQKKDELIYKLAHRDELTGLENRKSFYDTLEKARMEDNPSDLLILFITLEGVNIKSNLFSYEVNDQFILSIANALQHYLSRFHANISRWESHSFVVMIRQRTLPEHLVSHCEKSLEEFEQLIEKDSSEFFNHFKMGVYYHHFLDSTSSKDMIKNADIASEYAKRHDQKVVLFNQEVQDWAETRRFLEQDLKLAIEKNELVLYYQPQISVKHEEIVGFEALIRWNHRRLGFLTPNTFIELAEETGMIGTIGKWVLEQACRDAKALMEQHGRNFTISVNLSVHQLKDNQIVQQVQDVLQVTGLAPSQLDIEVTESMLIDGEHGIDVLHQLSNLGVSISLDDFGAGYSSLSYLHKIPYNRIKFDRSFVSMIESEGSPFVKEIIQLGQKLHATVLAEGVESAQQLAILRDYGIDEAQGYYYSKPIPKEFITFDLKKD